MIGFLILAVSMLFGVSLGMHLHVFGGESRIAAHWRRWGAAFLLGIAAWSASALLDTQVGGATEHSLLRFAALVVLIASAFGALRISARPRRFACSAAGVVIGAGAAVAAWLNVFAAAFDDPRIDASRVAIGVAAMLAGPALGAAIYPTQRSAWLRRGLAAIVVCAGWLGGAMVLATSEGRTPTLDPSASNTFVLLACAYASFILLMMIERDARREADNLSASLVSANEDILSFERRDPVTLLHHRAYFQRRVQAVFERVARRRGIAAVVVFGVEGLTLVNDTYGATSGDEVLRVVAGRLLARVRDDRAGRLGGGEFGAVMTRFRDIDELMVELNTIVDALSQPIEVEEESIHLSVSVGLAVYPCDGEGILPLTRATHAMQRAKRSGRNQICVFDPTLDCVFDRDLSVQSGLHRALSNGEFVLYLQPKCDVRTSAIVGAEALLRWDSPDGLVSPGEFIPVAERHGLIKEIGWFVIEEACRMLRRFRDRGILVPLSVNLAPGQFVDPGLIQRLCETLARHGVSPGSLCLEITESMAVENAEHMSAVLSALRSLGFRVAMDDFGTGYSSLAKLVSLPVDELKLDRSFLVDIESDLRSRSIVQAVVELAHACGCIVVAEGVETRGQAALIAQFGADQAQGYHWHRPMTCAAFIEIVEGAQREEPRRLALVKG